jgi:hypothetical protein
LKDGGGVVFRRGDSVELCGVLMFFVIAVTGQQGGLLVCDRSASVRRTSLEMPCRSVLMRPPGSPE